MCITSQKLKHTHTLFHFFFFGGGGGGVSKEYV